MTVRPVKVTAVLSSPLGAEPPMLDALCEAAMAPLMGSIGRTSNGHKHSHPIIPPGHPVPYEALGKIPVPIAREWCEAVDGQGEVLRLPIYRASSPIMASAAGDRSVHYTKAFPLEQVRLLTDRERTKITAGGGRFKSFRLPLRTRVVDRVVWFAALRRSDNDRSSPMSRMRKLLKTVRSIGKKTAHGYGAVAEWIVEPTDDDLSWFAASDAGPVLMRPLPSAMVMPSGLLGARDDYGAVCGPYWQREWWCERVVPC